MVGVKCISMAKVYTLHASSSLPTDPSPTPSPLVPPKLKPLSLKSQTTLEKKTNQNQRQLSVAEIERAIGAGIFRDRDTIRDAKENKTLFDSILSNSVGENEGDVEKKLRQTGEWLIDKTENTSASADFSCCVSMDSTNVDSCISCGFWLSWRKKHLDPQFDHLLK
ncbi:probable NAD(P)H dehydrogenase subunit CRR3, chloroplastic isoform X6 [Lycium barbarum]|uniref:probable NAD(P)H dehydrogenase subunit CRR3, chloroplastic isoform X6 n=1 Tax=Lycium barbarum TaxID=112863 RepID=UPI00293F76A4|nr:probable NAD(P)H dehydrogenase subunit CRR3, chloroplastic isoform X6 [Lycium barbarum]